MINWYDKLIRKIKIKKRIFMIMARIPAYPWDYFRLGREYLIMEEPHKAIKYFMIAGRIMAKRGYKSLAIEAFKEAKKIYQELQINNPSILRRDDYWNLGYIDYYLDPFPTYALIILD